MTTIISSQKYIDEATVASKRAAADYMVTVGKVITIDGQDYSVLIDGHHSLAAARADGVEPTYRTATVQECDREGIESVEDYLAAHWIDCDWYDVATGKAIF